MPTHLDHDRATAQELGSAMVLVNPLDLVTTAVLPGNSGSGVLARTVGRPSPE